MGEIKEEWKPVVGYEELYEVSNMGRVRTIKTKRVLKPGLGSPGYLTVYLYNKARGKRGKTYPVHTLVSRAFLGPRPHGLQVNHKDAIKTNNQSSNLEYVTPKENCRHAVRMGLVNHAGGRNPRAKLTLDQVLVIAFDAGSGDSYSKIGRKFGIHHNTVRDIWLGKSWAVGLTG